MRLTFPVLMAVAVLLAGGIACKKSQSPQTQDRFGIGIDWPKLESEFREHPDPNVRAAAGAAQRCILYHQFSQAILALDKLAVNPALTEAQKKLLVDIRAQTAQAMAKANPPPAQ